MAITVPRPNLKWSEKVYLPAIVAGMAITFRHLGLLFRDRLGQHLPRRDHHRLYAEKENEFESQKTRKENQNYETA